MGRYRAADPVEERMPKDPPIDVPPSAALTQLHERFAKSPALHGPLRWEQLAAELGKSPGKLQTLEQMEASGGEPNVVLLAGEVLVVDCSRQSPKGRRSLCFDQAARLGRRTFPPASSVEEMAAAMGVELLDEARYLALQELTPLDTTTSSWLATPTSIRELGGALFAERRYERVFISANGADAYFSSRGFRGLLRLGDEATLCE
jgi:hypothetical protein